MKQQNITLASPVFGNPNDTRQMSFFVARINDILRDIYNNLQAVKILTSEPTATELQELLNTSEVIILHHATQGSRCIYYKYQGTVYKIQSA